MFYGDAKARGDSILYSEARVIKTMQYCCKARVKWNSIKGTETQTRIFYMKEESFLTSPLENKVRCLIHTTQ